MKKHLLWIALALLIAGCGGDSSGSDGSDGGLPEYTNVTLQPTSINPEQTIQIHNGLTYKIIAGEAKDLYVSFYDVDNVLDYDHIGINSSGSQSCSIHQVEEAQKQWVSCTFYNTQSDITLSFNVENEGNTPLTYTIGAWFGSAGDGNTSDPVTLNAGEARAGHVGYTSSSYYTFAHTGGDLRISLEQIESMTGTAEDLQWDILDGLSGSYSSVASCDTDDYSDFNVSCLSTLDADTYYIRVRTNGQSAFSKYNITLK